MRVIFLLSISTVLVQAQATGDYPTLRKDAAEAFAKSQYDRALSLYRAGLELAESAHKPVEIAKCYADPEAAALRSAALGLMKRPEHRHPYYWAGFHLLGNGQ